MNKNKPDSDSVSFADTECVTAVEECETKETIDLRKAASVLFGMFLMGLLSLTMNTVPGISVVAGIFVGYLLLILYNRGVISKGD